VSELDLDFDPEELAMLRQLFAAEAHEGLEVVTTRVLAGGSARPSHDALTEMMRVTHTLKGAAGTVGLATMVDLSHRLEGALEAFDHHADRWGAHSADQLVEIVDGLRAYLDELIAGRTGTDAAADALRSRIDVILRGAPPEPDDRPSFESMSMAVATIVVAGEETEDLGVPRRAQTSPISEESAAHELADGAPSSEPKTWLRVEPERIDALMSSAGELLFDRTRIERRVQLLRTLARDLARTRQSLRDAIGDGSAASASPVHQRGALSAAESELAGQAALLSQTTAALLDEIEALRRTIGELQRGLTRIRMESARNLMNHAARTLRALRRATGVQVELRTVGEETEFDKAVAEQLVDPITQLLRNAVAHGIESSAERVSRGKPPQATVTIRARQDGNLLVLDVADDGRGVDTAALRERFVATGRWSLARAQLATDDDILGALLGTGVSVRVDADELAGRGVGLDLVRQTVARLGGEVRVTSAPGRGTTFSLRLPLSTSLAQAMLFKVGGQVYAIPNVHVVDTTLVDPGATTTQVRHEQLPIVRLETVLGHGATSDRRPGVVVTFAGKSLVCTVDKIVGPREIIIKPLGPLLAPLTLYAAATISGSGKVQLILDPAQLVRRAYPDAPEASADAVSAPMVLAGRALVVDDSRAIREAMTSMLGREGWIVDVAEDGARALHMAKQLRYDLVVTDLEMPELGGFELITRLRTDDRFAHTPIVIITSRASPEHRRRAMSLGVRALVAKPITRRKLLEALSAR
jgi:chemosensory pili system protein ChpA (sensor histidine kinase/response regulator)